METLPRTRRAAYCDYSAGTETEQAGELYIGPLIISASTFRDAYYPDDDTVVHVATRRGHILTLNPSRLCLALASIILRLCRALTSASITN